MILVHAQGIVKEAPPGAAKPDLQPFRVNLWTIMKVVTLA
jgi:hypothetical protein